MINKELARLQLTRRSVHLIITTVIAILEVELNKSVTDLNWMSRKLKLLAAVGDGIKKIRHLLTTLDEESSIYLALVGEEWRLNGLQKRISSLSSSGEFDSARRDLLSIVRELRTAIETEENELSQGIKIKMRTAA